MSKRNLLSGSVVVVAVVVLCHLYGPPTYTKCPKQRRVNISGIDIEKNL